MRMLKGYNEYVLRNLDRGYTRKDLGVSYVKERQLRFNMGIIKLRQKVREQLQEQMGKKLYTVAKIASMHLRWVAGFLEKFEEGCRMMQTTIKDKIQRSFNKSVTFKNAGEHVAGA